MSNQTKMTISEALVWIKKYRKDIESLSRRRVVPMFAVVGENTKEYVKSKQHTSFISNVQAFYDKQVSVFNNIIQLQSTIAISNAKCTVEINGKDYTVYEAITIKNNLDTQLQVLSNTITTIEDQQQQANQEAINKNVELSGKTGKPENMYVAYVDPHYEDYKKSKEQLEEFQQQVNSILNIHNATTYIEVEFI